MLEGVLESLLLHRLRLGDWLEGLSREALKVDIWKGKIQLKNLALKPAAFARLRLPLAVRYGHVEQLEVSIPWSALQSSPVRIHVSGVYLLLAPKTEADMRAEAEAHHEADGSDSASGASALRRREEEQHLARISEAEQMRQLAKSAAGAGSPSSSDAAQASFAEALLARVLANLEVHIDKIHVRIEQSEHPAATAAAAAAAPSSGASAAPAPLSFALGLTVASFSAVTTNAAGEAHFDSSNGSSGGDPAAGITHKSVRCSDVSLYCNPGARSWSSMPPAALRLSFSSGIARAADAAWWTANTAKSMSSRFSFLLLPLSPRMQVVLNRSRRDVSQPFLSVTLQLPLLPLAASREQCTVLLRAAEQLSRARVQDRQELLATIAHCRASRPLLPPFSVAAAEPPGAASAAAAAANASVAAPAKPPAQSNIRSWWLYAFQCVTLLSSVRRQRRRGFLSASSPGASGGEKAVATATRALHILEKAHLYRRYVPLYKRSLGAASWLTELSPNEELTMHRLELALEVRDVMQYRAVAEAELRAEASNQEKLLALERAEQAKRSFVAGWYGYLSGADKAASIATRRKGADGNSDSSSEAPLGIELSAEQRQALLDMLGADSCSGGEAGAADAGTGVKPALPRDYVLYAARVQVDQLTLDLHAAGGGGDGSVEASSVESMRLARLSVSGCSAELRVRPSSEDGQLQHPAEATLAVQSFVVEDRRGAAPATVEATAGASAAAAVAWPRILYSEAAVPIVPGAAGASSSSSSSSSVAVAAAAPFFRATYNRHPLDLAADHRVRASFAPVRLRVEPFFLAALQRFLPLTEPASATVAAAGAHDDDGSGGALRSVASEVSAAMQAEFVRSLADKRLWDVEVQAAAVAIVIPTRGDSPVEPEEEALILSCGAIVLRSQLASAASASGVQPLLLQRHLPAALHEHPDAYDRFSLDVQTVAVQLCASEASWSTATVTQYAADSSSLSSSSSLFVLAPQSVALSLHLLVRPALLDVHGQPLLLPRAVLSSLLPDLQLQVSQQVVAFAARWAAQAQHAFAAQLPAAQRLAPPQPLMPVSSAAEADVSPLPSGVVLPAVPAAAPNVPAALPRVRTQLHAYFGVLQFSLTVLAPPVAAAHSSSSHASPAAALQPLLCIAGHGCSVLVSASAHESNVLLGLEAAQVDCVPPSSAAAPHEATTVVAITSKHLAHAPGGAAASTLLCTAEATAGDEADHEALQLRVITLLGPALHTTPLAYAKRPPAAQFVDARVSCIRLDWEPTLMLRLQQWLQQIQWPQQPAAANAEEEKLDTGAGSVLSSAPAPSANPADLSTPSVEVPSRFLSLLTARIDDVLVRCLAPAASAAVNRCAPPALAPSQPLVVVSAHLQALHACQGIYRRDARGVATDFVAAAGVGELSVQDGGRCAPGSSDDEECAFSPAEHDPTQELFSCRMSPEEERKGEEAEEEKEEEKKGEQPPPVDPSELADLPAHVRFVLPPAPTPLLVCVDTALEGSPRFRGIESHVQAVVRRGVSICYLRARFDRLMAYASAGALGDLGADSRARLAARMNGVWAQRTRLQLCMQHPAILIPRSSEARHRGQHLRADLGRITLRADNVLRPAAQLEPYADAAAQPEHQQQPQLLLPMVLQADVQVQIASMQLTCPFGSGEPSVSSAPKQQRPLIRDVNFGVDVQLLLPERSAITVVLPAVMSVRGTLSDFVLRLTRLQSLLLQRINLENLLTPGGTVEEEFPSLLPSAAAAAVHHRVAAESKSDDDEASEQQPAATAAADASLSWPAMTVDVRMRLTRLRVEMLASATALREASDATSRAGASSGELTMFAAALMDEMNVSFSASDMSGASCTISTRQMSISDCRELEQKHGHAGAGSRTIFYPLHPGEALESAGAGAAEASSSSSHAAAAPAPIDDELSITWSRRPAVRATASAAAAPLSPTSSSSAPPPDRLRVLLVNPCILLLPDFLLLLADFAAPETADDIHALQPQQQPSSKVASFSTASPPGGFEAAPSLAASSTAAAVQAASQVGNLSWLDLHVSVLNARALLPHSGERHAQALVTTASLHFTSTNVPTPVYEQARDVHGAPSPSVQGHSQEVEIMLEQIAIFHGSIDQPLQLQRESTARNNKAPRMLSCSGVQATLQSVFRNARPAFGDFGAVARKVTTTASLRVEPTALHLSYMDALRVGRIVDFFRAELDKAEQHKAALEARKAEARGGVSDARPKRRRRLAHSPGEGDWTAADREQHRQWLLQQQRQFADDECVCVPQLLDELETAEDEPEESAPSDAGAAGAAAAASDFVAAEPVVSFGWLQVFEMKCSSVSLLLFDDLAVLEGERERLASAAEASSPSTATHELIIPATALAPGVPLLHLCLVDVGALVSRPRSQSSELGGSNSSGRSADVAGAGGDDSRMEILLAGAHAAVHLSAYDPAGNAWNTLLSSCIYELNIENQQQQQPQSPKRDVSAVRYTAASSASAAAAGGAGSFVMPKSCLSLQLRATQPQEVHITDRTVSTALMLLQRYTREMDRTAKRKKDKKAAAAASSAASLHSHSAPPALLAASSLPAVSHSSFSPFRLRNLTANSLCACVTFGAAAGAPAATSSDNAAAAEAVESSFTIVAPSEEQALLLPHSGGLASAGPGAQAAFVSIELGPSTLLAAAAQAAAPPGGQATASACFRPLRHVPVAQVGTLVYELQLAGSPPHTASSAAATTSSPAGGSGVFLQVKISMAGGSKLLELSSLHSVHNVTALPMQLRLLNQLAGERAAAALPALELGLLSPGATIHLPLDEPGQFVWAELQLRPADFPLTWSGTGGARAAAASSSSSSNNNPNSDGTLRRSTLSSLERSVMVTVCRPAHGLDEENAGDHAVFVTQVLARSSQHIASSSASSCASPTSSAKVYGSTPAAGGSTAAAGSSAAPSGPQTYSRIQLELLPPLTLANLFLCPMQYQVRARPSAAANGSGAGGALLLAHGSMQPGEKVSVHECDVRRAPQVRFKLLDVSADKEAQAARVAPAGGVRAAAPQSSWSEWIGLEQLQQRPVFDCVMQVEAQSASAAALPLHAQIRRSASVASGAVSLSFLVPFWLNVQCGLPLRFSQSDSVWENERFLLFKWRPPSLPTDRDNFSNENGSRRMEAPHKLPEHLPANSEWAWFDAGWQVEVVRGRTDANGWQYGVDFPDCSRAPADHNEPLHAVRRRKWFRHRMLKPLHVVGGAAVGLPAAEGARPPAATIGGVRMFGAPSSVPSPGLSVSIAGNPAAPAAPIDLAHAATDSLLLLLPPHSHRAAGVALPRVELAVHVDTGPGPFEPVKVISFHARFLVHNCLPRALRLRQKGCDPRAERLMTHLAPGQTGSFQPWLLVPADGSAPPRQFGVHVSLDGSPWSMPFPIQRVGEFAIKFPVLDALPVQQQQQQQQWAAASGPPRMGGAGADDKSVLAGPMYVLRVRVELVRAVLHIHLLPETSFIVQPSTLLSDEHDSNNIAHEVQQQQQRKGSGGASGDAIAGSGRLTGSMYRIDNRTPHKLFVQQLQRSRRSSGSREAGLSYRRSATALPVAAHTSSVYAFDAFDLSIDDEHPSAEAAAVLQQLLQSVTVEVEQALTEQEQLQQMEAEFNGMQAQPRFTAISFDEVGAQALLRLAPSAAHLGGQPHATPGVPGSESAFPSAALPSRALHLLIVPDGSTRVLVVRPVARELDADDEADFVAARSAVRAGQDPHALLGFGAADHAQQSVPERIVTVDFQLKEINLSLLAVGELAASLQRDGTAATPGTTRGGENLRPAEVLARKLRQTNFDVSSFFMQQQRTRELLFVQLQAVHAECTWTPAQSVLQLRLGRYQADNSARNAIYPVVLHSTLSNSRGGATASTAEAGKNANVPAVYMLLSMPAQPQRASTAPAAAAPVLHPLYIDRVLLQLQSFCINLDEDCMRGLAAFAQHVATRATLTQASPAAAPGSRVPSGSLVKQISSISPQELVLFLQASPSITRAVRSRGARHPQQQQLSWSNRMLYIRRIELGALRMRVSYTPVAFLPTGQLRKDPLRKLHQSLGSIRQFLDCEDARVELPAFKRVQLFTSLPALQASVNKLYTAAVMTQSVRLLASAKTFGSPLGVLSSVRAGLREFVADESLERGTLSLVNHTAHGMSAGTAGLTGSLGGQLARMSGDSAYQAQRRSHLQSDRPQTASAGFKSGAKHLGAGVLDGLTGLVSQPLRGAQQRGVEGALAGAGKGLLGFFVKPLTGAVDAIHKASQGVSNQAKTGTPEGRDSLVQRVERTPSNTRLPVDPSATPAQAVAAARRQAAATAAAGAAAAPPLVGRNVAHPVSTSSASASAAGASSPASSTPSPVETLARRPGRNNASAAASRLWQCNSCGCYNGGDNCVVCGAPVDL